MIDVVIGILSSLGTGLLTLLGVIITNNTKDKVRDAKTEADISTLRSDIERLERKQDAHNKLIERMYDVESDIKVIHEKIHEIEK